MLEPPYWSEWLEPGIRACWEQKVFLTCSLKIDLPHSRLRDRFGINRMSIKQVSVWLMMLSRPLFLAFSSLPSTTTHTPTPPPHLSSRSLPSPPPSLFSPVLLILPALRPAASISILFIPHHPCLPPATFAYSLPPAPLFICCCFGLIFEAYLAAALFWWVELPPLSPSTLVVGKALLLPAPVFPHTTPVHTPQCKRISVLLYIVCSHLPVVTARNRNVNHLRCSRRLSLPVDVSMTLRVSRG